VVFCARGRRPSTRPSPAGAPESFFSALPLVLDERAAGASPAALKAACAAAAAAAAHGAAAGLAVDFHFFSTRVVPPPKAKAKAAPLA